MSGKRLALHARYAGYGLLLGFVLSRIGFSRYDELHRMFIFADLRMLLSFAGAVMLCAAGFALSRRHRRPPRQPMHRGTIIGSVLFGLGWVVSGACPAIALVQLGEGQLMALLTLGGILAGVWLYPLVHGRFFKWDTGSCEM